MADRDRRSTIYVPWSPGIQPTWTVAQVRTALREHEQGQFATSAKLARAMGRDDRFAATEGTRVRGLLGCKFSLQPGVDDDAAAAKMAEELEPDIWKIFPETEIFALLRWYYELGGGLGELRWEQGGSFWMPRLLTWDPQFLSWEDTGGSDEEGHLVLQTRQGPLVVTPGDGKWILLGEGLRWWWQGAIRSLAVPWMARQFALRDWVRHSERLGQPVLLAKVPADVDVADKEGFIEDLKALSTETTVTLPQGVGPKGESFDLELLEASGENWEGMQALLHATADMFSVRLLGHNLTTEVRGGSYAAAETGEGIRCVYTKSDAQLLSTVLREHVIQPIRVYNYASSTPEQAPWPFWEVDPPEDLTGAATRLGSISQALTAAEVVRQVDIRALLELHGVPLLAEEDVEEKVEPPTPPILLPGVPRETPEGEDQEEEEPEEKSGITAGVVRLASGDSVASAPAFVAGQLAVEQIAADGERLSRRAIGPTVRAVLEIIDKAPANSAGQPDVGAIREQLLALYEDTSTPDDLVQWLERAQILAELKGREAVLGDL